MSHLMDEIASQPECWAKAIELAAPAGPALPAPGERVAVIGCGSSLNVARCYASLREAAGQGETDAFPASEVPATRRYDHMVYVSRTGTTTEVLDALRRAPAGVRTTAIAADPGSPLVQEAGAVVLLDFSAERSVVSSRFITSTIVLLRAHLGEDLRALPDAAARELARPLPPGLAEHTRVHLPRPRLGGRGGRRGGAEAARGLADLGRVLPGAGVPARPDQRQRREHRGLGPGPGAAQPAGRRPPHRGHGHRLRPPTRWSA